MSAERAWKALRESVGRAVVGAHEPLRLLTAALLVGGHVLVEDVPGVGKTLLAKAFARSLGLSFARVQGTPDLLPTDVTGSSVLEGGATFTFQPGPIFNNVVLFDEINRATPRTQSALLEAMQERQVSVDGQTRVLPKPFVVLATQNPIELEGTFALPEAQLDRFLVRVQLGYLDEPDERQMLRRLRGTDDLLESLTPVLHADALDGLTESVRSVLVAEEVESYLLAVVRATREHPDVHLGASPRAAVALYRASQAWAALDGRDFVIPDDVQQLIKPVLGHRLVLDLDRELRGATRKAVLDDVVNQTPVRLAEAS